jgi:hypothetical protein
MKSLTKAIQSSTGKPMEAICWCDSKIFRFRETEPWCHYGDVEHRPKAPAPRS